MKKTLLFTAALAATVVSARAQTFTNSSFETWQGPSGLFQIETPESWFGSDGLTTDNFNAIFLQSLGVTPQKQIFKSTDAHSGSFAARLQTVDLDTLGNVPGALVNAKIAIDIAAIMAGGIDFSNILNMVTYSGGTPILGKKVDSVNAWVKLTTDNMDNASIIIRAMKKAKTPSGSDTMVTIGGGTQIIMKDVSNDYREISVPVLYTDPNNTATDTLIVAFSSSAVTSATDTSTDGNTLLVDDVSMTTSQGSTLSIRQPLFADDIALVYPNPAIDKVYFNLNTNQTASDYMLTVVDVTGKVVLIEKLKQQVNEKSVSGWAKGSYFYTLANTKNGKSVKGKFSVQ